MKKKFVKLLMTFVGVSVMLLIAVGSNTAPQYPPPSKPSPPPNPYGNDGGCDDWLVENYLYHYQEYKYKAAYFGNGKCFRGASNESQQDAINFTKATCEKEGPYCYLLAVGNQMHGYLHGTARSRYSGQYFNIPQNHNYIGENNVCTSSVPGGCDGAFKP